jgi:cob(I)alamin adenosyltransferase
MGLSKGLIHVYTGSGKGKTTTAIGLGIRAAGAGLQVYMVQFMKGRKYCELSILDDIEHFSYSQHGRDEFVNKDHPEQIDIDLAVEGLSVAKDLIESNKYDMIILDEINVAVDFGLLPLEEILQLIEKKPTHLELVLTGRYADKEIIRIADYVTEMLEIKHPYQTGVEARKGCEF